LKYNFLYKKMVLDHSLKEYKYFTFQKPPNLIWIGNLTGFYLQDNQLSGITPDEICNPTQLVVNLENNQLCPPYPSCIEDYVGEQDTSDCD